MNDLTLQETIELMEEYDRMGYETYFEGRGDGFVNVFAEAVFINEKIKKINVRLISKS
jgi:hypothetical protein